MPDVVSVKFGVALALYLNFTKPARRPVMLPVVKLAVPLGLAPDGTNTASSPGFVIVVPVKVAPTVWPPVWKWMPRKIGAVIVVSMNCRPVTFDDDDEMKIAPRFWLALLPPQRRRTLRRNVPLVSGYIWNAL